MDTRGVGQDARGDRSAPGRNISLADAAHLEATVGPRTVRAKHLPQALQRRYGMGAALLQPVEVHSVRRVFEEAPYRYFRLCACKLSANVLFVASRSHGYWVPYDAHAADRSSTKFENSFWF